MMVKNSEMTMSLFSSRKKVSFDAKETVALKPDPAGVERLPKVAETLNGIRTDCVQSGMGNPRKNSPSQSRKDYSMATNSCKTGHQDIACRASECNSPSEFTGSGMRDYRTNSLNQLSLIEIVELPVTQQIDDPCSAVDSGKLPESLRTVAIERLSEVAEATPVVDSGVVEQSRCVTDRETGNRQGTGEDDGLAYFRGYSRQKRHGRKASLGSVDITKLIPNLVSENEDFRHQEYHRKLSAPHTKDLLSGTW